MSEETMTFHEKLNDLMNALEVSNPELASCAGFDRTNISHFRSGKRIPSKNGPAAKKLVAGLLQYAKNEEKLQKLQAVIGDTRNLDDERALFDALLHWLFEGVTDRTEENKGKKHVDARTFGVRLEQAMKLAELSNNRLGQLLNVDASLRRDVPRRF